jgi:hypothetical protein
VDWEQDGSSTLNQELVIENGLAWLRGANPQGNLSGVVVVADKKFEELDDKNLGGYSYKSHLATVPNGDGLEGTILAVRTAWGRYAKVRVDLSQQKAFILRWITYNAQPAPTVEITGTLQHEHGENPEDTKCWGTFSIDTHGIYRDYGLDIVWNYQGPGKATVDVQNSAVIRVHIDFATDLSEPPPTLDLSALGLKTTPRRRAVGTLTVQVTDIFGRSAMNDTVIWCQSPSVSPDITDIFHIAPGQIEFEDWLLGPHPDAKKLRAKVLGFEAHKLSAEDKDD